MDLNNWLLWLMIGIVVGFLIEFLVDYFFFGRRNKDLASQMDRAKAEVRQLQKSTDDLKTELAKATAAQVALQTRVDDVTVGAAADADILPMVAGAGGLVGVLGDSLLHADRVGTALAVTALKDALADRERLEQTVQELRSSASALEYDLSETQVALQREADDLGAEKTSVRRNFAVLTAAGGVVGALGAALDGGDEAAVRRAVAVVAAELARQPEVVRVEVPDTRAVNALQAQLAEASVRQETLQIQVDDFSAQAIAMVSRIGLVTAAGDLLSDLGTALASGDETAVLASVNAIKARLAAGSAAQSSTSSQTKG